MAPESSEHAVLKAVGTVEVVHGTAVAQSSAGERALAQGDPVYQGETVVTGADSALEIRFVDDTVLSQGQESVVNVDTFVFDPDTGAGEVFLKISQGVFRSVTGAIVDHNPDSFKIQSPLATIGIRGTTTGHFVPAGGGEENHGCLEYDGKPVVVQSNMGGPPQTLFQAGMSVGAGLGGLGAVQPYTAGQIGFFDALAPQNIGGWSAPESPFAGPGGDEAGQADEPSGQDAGGEPQGGDGDAGTDSGTGDGTDTGTGGDADPGAAPADAASSPIGGDAGDGAATQTLQLAVTGGVVGDSPGQSAMAGAPSMGFAAAGTDMAGESLALAGASLGSAVQGPALQGFASEAVATAQATVDETTGDDDYTSVDPEYAAEQVAFVVSPSAVVAALAEVVDQIPTAGGSSGEESTASGPTSMDFLSFAGPNGVYVNLDPSASGDFGEHVPFYSYDGTATRLADSVVNISGSGYADTIEGDERTNVITGNCGNDVINGLAGNDVLEGAGDVDQIDGGAGNDIIDGGDGDDSTLAGGTGNDIIQGGNGSDTLIFGNDGADMLYGADIVYTAAGDDGAVDSLNGGAGNDVLFASKGNDIFVGGDDTDTLTYSYPSGDFTYPQAMEFTISSANAGSATDGTYTHSFSEIECLVGSGLNDRFYISSATSMILDGAGGDDEFKFTGTTNIGASIVNFTSGNDKLYFNSASFTGSAEVGTTAPVSGDFVFIDTSAATNIIYYDADWSDAAGRVTVGTVEGDAVAAGDVSFY